MKKKSIVLSLAVVILIVATAGCGNTANKKSEASNSELKSTENNSSTTSSMMIEKDSVVYTAVVKEDSSSEIGQIWVGNLISVDSTNETPEIFKDDVVLLTDGSNVFNGNNEKISLDEIKLGDEVEIAVDADPVSTMSIPPQIPGNAIHKIILK